MNLPNKITITRIVLSIIALLLMVFPFYQIGYTFPTYLIAGKVTVSLKYLICAGLFIIASLTDFLDGYLARKRNEVTDYGKVMDAIADKMLVNGILIVLASDGFIPICIPVIVITRDVFVDAIKMAAGRSGHAVGASILGKVKTVFMMIGIALMLVSNLPFELVGIRVADSLIILATVLSVISGVQYYYNNKSALREN